MRYSNNVGIPPLVFSIPKGIAQALPRFRCFEVEHENTDKGGDKRKYQGDDRSSEAILRRIDNRSVNGIVEFDIGLLRTDSPSSTPRRRIRIDSAEYRTDARDKAPPAPTRSAKTVDHARR
ncbi:hypothetical protein QZM91_01980 [Burkholderia multivorans]|nr:hypothetical protein [Burkholderia multivorans]